jgi:hypothetical protein
MESVIDAQQAGNREALFGRLNALVRRWVQTRLELTE